jgi:hypothetical protein
MTHVGDNGKNPKKPKQPSRRSHRLAAALRENLRRRKAQDRQRGALSAPEPSAKPIKDG